MIWRNPPPERRCASAAFSCLAQQQAIRGRGPVASTRALCQNATSGDVLAADIASAETYTLLLDGPRLIIEPAEAAYTFNAF